MARSSSRMRRRISAAQVVAVGGAGPRRFAFADRDGVPPDPVEGIVDLALRQARPRRRLGQRQPVEGRQRTRCVACCRRPSIHWTRCCGPTFSADRGAAEEAGADGHGRREERVEAGRAGRAAGIHRDAQHVHLRAEAQDDRGIARHGSRPNGPAPWRRIMARQAVIAASRVADLVEAEHRAELLAAQRIVVADALERHEQHARAARHRMPAALRDRLGRLAEQRDVELARREEVLLEPVALLVATACGSCCRFSSSASRSAIAAWAMTADSLVQRMRIVEGLGVGDQLGGAARHPPSRRHRPGTLPGPTPIAGLPERVGGAHHRRAAGREDQVDAVGLHDRRR